MTNPHVVVEGDGPVVVLASSLGTDLHVWDAQAAVLARTMCVVRYDLRGHGATPWSGTVETTLSIDDLARDLLAALDRVGADQASICGISLGGMAAMAAARLAPERVDRLVLCCTAAHLPPAAAWRERADVVRASGTAAVADMVLGRWFTERFRATNPAEIARIRAMLLATEPDVYAACCDAIADMDQRRDLGAIGAPTLVIAADEDPSTPPAHGEEIAAAIPGARVLVVPGAAHLVNVERPDVVTAAILGHLDPAATVGDAAAVLVGDRIRREVLGDAHVDASAVATPLTADFQRWITKIAWGDVWGRPGLDRRTRSAITVAVLAALGRQEELALHLRAARKNGLTSAEIGEVLLHCAVYTGVPAANSAFAVARKVLDDEP